jgi:phospholipid/cholesterol/gamma-HCH transport system substrate-binding protein
MTLTSTQPHRKRVWAFLFGSLLLLLLLVGGLAHEQGWFTPTMELRFQASSANELRTGMQVRLLGVPLGKVSEVRLDELAQVQVTLQIAAEYARFLGTGTRAVKARDGLFGDSYIELIPGKGGKLVEQSVLPFEDDPGLGGIVNQLRDRLFPVLDNLQQFTATLNDPNGDWRQVASETKTLLQELRQSRKQLDQMLAGIDTLSRKQLPNTLKETEASLLSIRTLASNADQRFAEISDKLQATLASLDQGGKDAAVALQSLQTLLDVTRPQLTTVLQDTETLLKNANTTVDNMQSHWPFTPPDDKKPTEKTPD